MSRWVLLSCHQLLLSQMITEFVTLFLQVLDDGRLTDGQGRLVDFRNTVIIMTSNLGAAYLNDMGEGPVSAQTSTLVTGAIQMHFPPEFINRIDEVVIFVSLYSFPAVSVYFIVLAHIIAKERSQDRRYPTQGNRGAPCGKEDHT